MRVLTPKGLLEMSRYMGTMQPSAAFIPLAWGSRLLLGPGEAGSFSRC